MGIPGDLGQALALPGGQRPVGVHEHQIHVPDDVVERRVQLVADRRQEFLFDAIGGLIGLLGGEGGAAAGGDVPEEERLPGGPVIAVWMWQAAEFDPALALGSVDGSLALAGGSRVDFGDAPPVIHNDQAVAHLGDGLPIGRWGGQLSGGLVAALARPALPP